jgi:hypothetical protein
MTIGPALVSFKGVASRIIGKGDPVAVGLIADLIEILAWFARDERQQERGLLALR